MTRSRRSICNLAAVLALAIAGGGLAGCAQAPGFPSLPSGDVFGQRTLTPDEQDAEIKELADAQVQNTAQATGSQSPPQYIPASTIDVQ
jgi:hypothetical protein